MKNLIIWGGTGQAKVLREALCHLDFRLLAIFDNRSILSPFDDIPIYKGQKEFESWLKVANPPKDLQACVAIGGSRGEERLAIQQWLQDLGIMPLTVVHPRAFVASDAKVGAGSQILAMAAVCSSATLGRSVIVNTSSSIDHDCIVEDGAHIGPGACIAGEVQVGRYAFVGAGAVVLPRLIIGAGAIVGAGAVVTRNVSSGETVAGAPAKPLNFRGSYGSNQAI